jgi:hypothetical protein
MEFYLTPAKRVLGESDNEALVRIFEAIFSWLEPYLGLWGVWTIILGGLALYLIIVNQVISKT